MNPLTKRLLSSYIVPVATITVGALSTLNWTIAYAQETISPPIVENLGKDASTEINVKNADIAAIVKIFSKKTKRNYILDERVKGKVSIYLPGKVSSDEALRILESVLSFKGFTSVPISENLWKIVPSREARQTTIPTVSDTSENPTAAMVTKLLNLKYVSSEEMKQLVSQLVSPDGLVNAYTGTNSLIVIDAEDNIARLERLVAELDVPYSNQDMTIIPVVHADAKEIAEKLNEILGDKSKSGDGKASLADPFLLQSSRNITPTNAMNAPGGGAPASSITPAGSNGATVAARAKEPKIIPDDRTNSIIVVADEDTTLRIRALISQLDSKMDLSGSKFYVYRCQHANAEELAEILSGLSGGGSSGSTTRSATSAAGGFGGDTNLNANSRSRSRTNSRQSSGSSTSGSSMGGSRSSSTSGGGRSGGVGTVSLGDEISITADPATNSLIISASKSDYQKLLALLEKLDIKRRQVLVEAMLLEVTVKDEEAFGLDFLASGGSANGGMAFKGDFSGNLTKLFSDPASLSNFSVAAASAGTLTLPNNVVIPSQSVLLTALKGNSNVNVLSSPNILTTDNEQAEIIVGENVPVISSTSTNEQNLSNTFNQVDRQDVGITLRLTPQISSGDSVTLKLFTEVSKLVSSPLDAQLGPTTQQRKSETTVIAKDAQMVVIGGLMSDDIQDSKSGVPFLRDIPVLGALFGVSKNSFEKRNLLIFITPHIIKDQYDARDATIELRDRMDTLIKDNELTPDRKDVLHNIDVDRVSELSAFDGQKPTTITAPPQVKNGEQLSHSGASNLNVTVSPELPEVPDAARIKPALAPSAAQEETGRFVVFHVDSTISNELVEKLPFKIARDSSGNAQRILVELPEESDETALRYFSVGQRYSYAVDSETIQLTPLGKFASKREAEELASAGSESYTLSPYEIMNLGERPWSKASLEAPATPPDRSEE
jgi:general secretion pathway protein D